MCRHRTRSILWHRRCRCCFGLRDNRLRKRPGRPRRCRHNRIGPQECCCSRIGRRPPARCKHHIHPTCRRSHPRRHRRHPRPGRQRNFLHTPRVHLRRFLRNRMLLMECHCIHILGWGQIRCTCRYIHHIADAVIVRIFRTIDPIKSATHCRRLWRADRSSLRWSRYIPRRDNFVVFVGTWVEVEGLN